MADERDLALQLDAQPFDLSSGLRRLDLTAVDDSIELAPGRYLAQLTGSIDGLARLGAEVVVPASKDPEVSGSFPLPAGLIASFQTRGNEPISLHARLLTAGTATLWLVRVVL